MSEAKSIVRSTNPVTVGSLSCDLRGLGVGSGDVLLVHSSMSALGWVCGGAVAVVEALMCVLTCEGTLVMPTHSAQLSEPSHWRNPPVPESWWSVIRDSMPPFDPVTTPTRGMGSIPESFRMMPGVVRSDHPTCSMSAWGAGADEVVGNHSLTDPHGNESPLGRIYDMDGKVLLLGVGHVANTSMHLGERRAFGGSQAMVRTGAPMRFPEGRRWIAFEEPDVDSGDFAKMGNCFETASNLVVKGKIGMATGVLMSQRDLVDFSIQWLGINRDSSGRMLDDSV